MSVVTHRLLSEGKQLGIGATGALYVTLSAVAKRNGKPAPYCLANELICAEVGRTLGLPIPPYALIDLPSKPPDRPEGGIAFASLDFNLLGVSLPPLDPATCVQHIPDQSTGLVLFDVLIINTDRHRGNVSLDLSGSQPRLSVFDHSHALMGNISGNAVERLEKASDKLCIDGQTLGGNRECLLDALKDDHCFEKWLSRIESIPDFLIDDLSEKSIALGCTTEESKKVGTFLKHRKADVRNIIMNNKPAFKSITQWSLFA